MVQILTPDYRLLAQAYQTDPVAAGLGAFTKMQAARQAAQMAPLKQQYMQAETQAALAKAQQPFAGQHLIGPAGMAQSDILFQQKYGGDPAKMRTYYQEQSYRKRALNARLFTLLPSDERDDWVAKASGLGFSQGQAVRYFANGGSLGEMQQMVNAGMKPSTIADEAENFNNKQFQNDVNEVNYHGRPIHHTEITPKYPLQQTAKVRQQEAAQATAGMDVVSNAITNGLNYGGVFSHITRPWFWDSQSKDPTKQQKAVNYYAAHSLKAELALYRMRIQGGMASARAMKALMPTILGNVKNELSYLPSQMQQRVQDRVRNVLDDAVDASAKQALSPNPTVYKPRKRTVAPIPKTTTTPRTQTTKRDITELSEDELRKIIARGKK